ncbi:hypothetical protein N7456_008881 [Penicillium angulare]|uniref:Uncharacterized protein n=1 Tax=Penicillium angulare TaxID=116970 RepID=A0A9W9F3M6_9EURO|nr:hypothetical protein N7456_008881 [Penicillium angulare]
MASDNWSSHISLGGWGQTLAHIWTSLLRSGKVTKEPAGHFDLGMAHRRAVVQSSAKNIVQMLKCSTGWPKNLNR